MARKNVKKNHVRFDFSQLENKKNNRKPLKELPWKYKPISQREEFVYNGGISNF